MNSEVKREDAIVPCRHACPAHTDIPRYIRHVKNEEYDEAVAVIREKVPFPKALGYICTHVCELECKRKEVNEAMSIRDIKRYAAEGKRKTAGRYRKESLCRRWRTGWSDSSVLSEKTGT